MARTEEFHLYDSFALDMAEDAVDVSGVAASERTSERTLFRRMGPRPFTNVMTPNQINDDGTAILQNWCAHTSICPTDDFQRWSSGAVCELSIGSQPCDTKHLPFLLARQLGERDINMDAGFADRVTEKMYNAYQHETGSKNTWADTSKHDRSAWLESFRVARAEMQPSRTIAFIPVRQNFGVRVSWRTEDVTPELLAHRPRVWVHLEGLTLRGVC
jgi:hypothetical protein